jgi:tetratricopeptide (TPR) repeat protein
VVKYPRLRAALIGAASTICAIISLKLLVWVSNSSAANLFDYLYENVQLGISDKIASLIPLWDHPWPEMPISTFILLVLIGASASLCRKAVPATLITIFAFLALASWGETARQAEREYWLKHRIPFSSFGSGFRPPCRPPLTPAACEARQYYLSGLIYYDAGNFKSAEKEWERAHSFDPANREIATGLERVKLFTGQPPRTNSKSKNPSKKGT